MPPRAAGWEVPAAPWQAEQTRSGADGTGQCPSPSGRLQLRGASGRESDQEAHAGAGGRLQQDVADGALNVLDEVQPQDRDGQVREQRQDARQAAGPDAALVLREGLVPDVVEPGFQRTAKLIMFATSKPTGCASSAAAIRTTAWSYGFESGSVAPTGPSKYGWNGPTEPC